MPFSSLKRGQIDSDHERSSHADARALGLDRERGVHGEVHLGVAREAVTDFSRGPDERHVRPILVVELGGTIAPRMARDQKKGCSSRGLM